LGQKASTMQQIKTIQNNISAIQEVLKDFAPELKTIESSSLNTQERKNKANARLMKLLTEIIPGVTIDSFDNDEFSASIGGMTFKPAAVGFQVAYKAISDRLVIDTEIFVLTSSKPVAQTRLDITQLLKTHLEALKLIEERKTMTPHDES
jgi:hypothetical protein